MQFDRPIVLRDPPRKPLLYGPVVAPESHSEIESIETGDPVNGNSR